MKGRTHLAVGVASSLFVAPHLTGVFTGFNLNVTSVLLGVSVAGVGALLPDIDIKGSDARRGLTKILSSIALLIVFGFILRNNMIMSDIKGPLDAMKGSVNVVGLVLFVVSLVFGFFSNHRSYTHSLLGFAVFSYSVYLLLGGFWVWFAIGYLSHILIDLFNCKGERLLFPLEKSFCLNLCSSDGLADSLLCLSSSMLFVYLIIPYAKDFVVFGISML